MGQADSELGRESWKVEGWRARRIGPASGEPANSADHRGGSAATKYAVSLDEGDVRAVTSGSNGGGDAGCSPANNKYIAHIA